MDFRGCLILGWPMNRNAKNTEYAAGYGEFFDESTDFSDIYKSN